MVKTDKKQEAQRPKIIGIHVIGWIVLLSNTLLITTGYILPAAAGLIYFPEFLPLLSTVAVFPYDFYMLILPGEWYAHLGWIITVMFCSIGIMYLKQIARMTLIVLCIIHAVILTYIVITKSGSAHILDFFFRLYFNLVAVGAYIGFLTIAESRQAFGIEEGSGRFQLWLKRLRYRTLISTDSQGFYNLGVAYLKLDRIGDAVISLEKAVEINSQEAKYLAVLGCAYLKQNKFAQAVKALKKAIHIDPVHKEAIYHLGVAQQKQGCDKEAAEIFRKLTHASPQNFQAFNNLGQSLLSIKRVDDAISAFKEALKLNPRDETAYLYLGQIYADDREAYDAAKEVLRAAIRINPANTEAQYRLGLVYIKLARFKEAIRTFKELIRMDQNNKQAYYQLGFAYAMIDDIESAKRQLDHLKTLDPDLAYNLSMAIKR